MSRERLEKEKLELIAWLEKMRENNPEDEIDVWLVEFVKEEINKIDKQIEKENGNKN